MLFLRFVTASSSVMKHQMQDAFDESAPYRVSCEYC